MRSNRKFAYVNLHIALDHDSSLKRSGMDHTVSPATHVYHKWHESYLPLLPAAERHLALAGTHFPSR